MNFSTTSVIKIAAACIFMMVISDGAVAQGSSDLSRACFTTQNAPPTLGGTPQNPRNIYRWKIINSCNTGAAVSQRIYRNGEYAGNLIGGSLCSFVPVAGNSSAFGIIIGGNGNWSLGELTFREVNEIEYCGLPRL